MNSKAFPLRSISSGVLKVSTWNPRADSDNNDLTYIDLSSIDQQKKTITATTQVAAKDAPSRARQIVHEGDILVSTVRPNLNAVAEVPKQLHGATASTGFCVLRPDGRSLDRRYLFHWVQSSSFIDAMVRFATGASYPAVSDRIVKGALIPTPGIKEQNRIATILDKAATIRRKRQQEIQLADELLRSVFLDMFGDPISNPRGWTKRPLEEVVDPERPITYGILKPGPDVEGGVPYIRVVDIQDGVVVASGLRRTTAAMAYEYRRSTLRAGDLLLSIRGHVGRVAIVPEVLDGANITQDTARIAPISEIVLARYILGCSGTVSFQREMQKYVKGAAIRGINLADVRKLHVPIPRMVDQRKFADIHVCLEKSLETQEAAAAEVDAMYGSLQRQAFGGGL